MEASVSTGKTRERLALSLAEVAEALGVSLSTLKREVARGELRVTRIGRRVVVRITELETYLQGKTERKSLTCVVRKLQSNG